MTNDSEGYREANMVHSESDSAATPSVYYGHMVLNMDNHNSTPFPRAPSISNNNNNNSNIHQLYHPYHQSPPVSPPDPPPALARFLTRAPSEIGRPVTFVQSDYYQNKTIRAEIEEIQGARLGRKCADPPTSTSTTTRTDSPTQPGLSGINNTSVHGSPRSSEGASRAEKGGRKDRRPLDPPPVVAMRLFEVFHDGTPERELPAVEEDHSTHVCHVDLFALPDDHDIDNPPPTLTVNLSSRRTEALIGSTYSAAAYIFDQRGYPAAYFVFRDLSVKSEGIFFLRYRIFDLYSFTSPSPSAPLPILAECFGRPFRVYSTKMFPGLEVSTPLTMHLNRWGVKVNFREGKRVRKGRAVGKRVLRDEVEVEEDIEDDDIDGDEDEDEGDDVDGRGSDSSNGDRGEGTSSSRVGKMKSRAIPNSIKKSRSKTTTRSKKMTRKKSDNGNGQGIIVYRGGANAKTTADASASGSITHTMASHANLNHNGTSDNITMAESESSTSHMSDKAKGKKSKNE